MYSTSKDPSSFPEVTSTSANAWKSTRYLGGISYKMGRVVLFCCPGASKVGYLGGGFNLFLQKTQTPKVASFKRSRQVSVKQVLPFNRKWWLKPMLLGIYKGPTPPNATRQEALHPGRLTWNIQITHLERKLIFQTSMIMFHVNLPGCTVWLHFSLPWFPWPQVSLPDVISWNAIYECPAASCALLFTASFNTGSPEEFLRDNFFQKNIVFPVSFFLFFLTPGLGKKCSLFFFIFETLHAFWKAFFFSQKSAE